MTTIATICKFILFWWTYIFLGFFILSIDFLIEDWILFMTAFCMLGCFISLTIAFVSEQEIEKFTGWKYLKKYIKDGKHFDSTTRL